MVLTGVDKKFAQTSKCSIYMVNMNMLINNIFMLQKQSANCYINGEQIMHHDQRLCGHAL